MQKKAEAEKAEIQMRVEAEKEERMKIDAEKLDLMQENFDATRKQMQEMKKKAEAERAEMQKKAEAEKAEIQERAEAEKAERMKADAEKLALMQENFDAKQKEMLEMQKKAE